MDSEEDGDKKKKKKENQRPNYFVSIPITNTQVRNDCIYFYILLSLEIMLESAHISSWVLQITIKKVAI